MKIVATGAFDDLRSRDVRFLEEASKLGELSVLLWDDEAVHRLTGTPSKFPVSERLYFLKALRYVSKAFVVPQNSSDALELDKCESAEVWADASEFANQRREDFCREHGLRYRIIRPDELKGFPAPEPVLPSDSKKVIVTGCYDWLHSGHIRFFEEVSSYGDLYAVVGHDANIRELKGPGHPLQPEEERRYMVGSVRYVKQALIATGHGWLDAEPEIARLRPDVYAVNEDGDKGGKREFCAQRGIQYQVLKRIPAPGLPQRSSTELRGF